MFFSIAKVTAGMTNADTSILKRHNLDYIKLSQPSREDLVRYFKASWKLNDSLFSSIIDEKSFFLSPDPLRNPLIFYLGHTAAFYVNKMRSAGLIKEGVNKRYDVIFEKGVDPSSPNDLNTHNISWPSYSEVMKYRAKVYDLVLKTINRIDLPDQVTPGHPLWALYMAFEHDSMHFETSSVLIRQLPSKFLKRPSGWSYAEDKQVKISSRRGKFIKINSAPVKIGKSDLDYFGWDLEYGTLDVLVDTFYVSESLVSNQEFLEFVKEGGYNNPLLWSAEGNQWRIESNRKLPTFWIVEGDNMKYRAMFDIIDFPGSWPVEVNYFEAEAYCKWKGNDVRLMTEPEYRLFAEVKGHDFQRILSFNNNLKYVSPTPVNDSRFKDFRNIYDVYGNVWQWLNTNPYPLDGFKPHLYYKDYSQPYFDKAHKMMLGGSWATNSVSSMRYYRNWFRPNFIQHAGFRLVKSNRF